jgi:hypothetical protein
MEGVTPQCIHFLDINSWAAWTYKEGYKSIWFLVVFSKVLYPTKPSTRDDQCPRSEWRWPMSKEWVEMTYVQGVSGDDLCPRSEEWVEMTYVQGVSGDDLCPRSEWRWPMSKEWVEMTNVQGVSGDDLCPRSEWRWPMSNEWVYWVILYHSTAISTPGY